MKKVLCVSAREAMFHQIEVGKFYYIDENSKWKDMDGNEYVMVYTDSWKEHTIGMILLSHFAIGDEYVSKIWYKVEMVNGSGSFPDKYDTYEAAYDAMCKNYVRELNEGYKPTLYKIVRYKHTKWNKGENTMVQPCWS